VSNGEETRYQGKIEYPNTCHIKVTVIIPPDTEPTAEKPSKMEILFSQCAEEEVAGEAIDVDLCEFIVCTIIYHEKNTMNREVFGPSHPSGD
jgi:hypothetical protein